MQDKTPHNDKGERHGLWEVYYYNAQLYWKGQYINGKMFGKHVEYFSDGELRYMNNFIDNAQHGYYQSQLLKKYIAR